MKPNYNGISVRTVYADSGRCSPWKNVTFDASPYNFTEPPHLNLEIGFVTDTTVGLNIDCYPPYALASTNILISKFPSMVSTFPLPSCYLLITLDSSCSEIGTRQFDYRIGT